MTSRRLIVCACVLTVLAARGTARAEPVVEERMLVVRAVSDAGDMARRLADGLGDALRARSVVLGSAPAPEPVPDEQEALARAATAYENLEPALARELLEGVLARAEATGGSGLCRADLVRALLLLALADTALSDIGAADLALDRVLAIEPVIELDPAVYSPAIRERVEARRDARAGSTPAVLAIEGVPTGAVVRVDGDVVAGPARTVELAPGLHLVHVVAPRSRGWGTLVDLPADGAVVAVHIEPDARAVIASPGLPGEPLDGLRAAGVELGVGLLVMDITTRGDEVEVEVHDLRSGREARTSGQESTPPAEVARVLASQLAPDEATGPSRGRRTAYVVSGVATAAIVSAVVLAIVLSRPWEDQGEPGWIGTWDLAR
jgi:hypothetical protein